MSVYIRSAISISPQHTFPDKSIPDEPVIYENFLENILPDFKSYFGSLERRRMSRIIKTGAACAIEAIQRGHIEKPDMIISGTGLGCVDDTEKFLNNVLTSETSMHTPTAFVQSTHNSIGALIAVKYHCHGYNVLYANKTTSFENALLDSVLQFNEGKTQYILLNGFDEITDENYQLKKRAHLFKSEKCSNLDVQKSKTVGTIPGEGATSFILSNVESPDNLARIDTVKLQYTFENRNEMDKWITESLAEHNLTATDIDLILSGKNGDIENDMLYQDLLTSHFNSSMHAFYKHLCGEYDTAPAFGLWFGTQVINNRSIPSYCLLNKEDRRIHRILLYHQDNFKNHSLILLSKC